MTSVEWWYVDGTERIGPMPKDEIMKLFTTNKLSLESYVWRKGFDNWKKIKEVEELKIIDEVAVVAEDPLFADRTNPIIAKIEIVEEPVKVKELTPIEKIKWDEIGERDRVFMIKTGLDRDSLNEDEFGPFSIVNLKKLYEENRICDKTFIFTKGLDNWVFLAELPFFQKVFLKIPAIIDEQDRRVNVRKPFIARMFFHDQSAVYEGMCRDISIGGMQILVSGFPGKRGQTISLNVHPDNNPDYHFAAKGVIVRELEGGHGFSIRFQDLAAEAERSIKDFIQKST